MQGKPRYEVAQICLNGHVVNSYAESHPEKNHKFCSRCGEPTIMTCPKCQTKILGPYIVPGLFGFGYEKPSYCHECGSMYPWTERAIKAAEELVDGIDELDPEEKAELKATFPHLVKETPQTKPSAIKFKRFFAKVKNGPIGNLLFEVLKNVVSAEVLKLIT